MTGPSTDPGDGATAYFWEIASEYMAIEGVEEGTLMGMPCLRVAGEFLATAWPRNGDLIARIPAQRVEELVAGGSGEPFAPAGKVFREWVSVPERDERTWRGLIDDALEFNRPDRQRREK
jgi:hypothetical protein